MMIIIIIIIIIITKLTKKTDAESLQLEMCTLKYCESVWIHACVYELWNRNDEIYVNKSA